MSTTQKNILKKPIYILAPMDEVTDVAFRNVVDIAATPDIFFTEFANVDGLQSPGRSALIKKLKKTPTEKNLIAQIWGKNPENFYKTTLELIEMGFCGVDINFGCPDKTIVKNNCCSAMIKPENRQNASDIIKAVKSAAGNKLPVSVKTRLGFNEIDLSWHEFLLKHDLSMLTVHARTRKEMSKVSAHWDILPEIVALRNAISPNTKIIGNGDVLNRFDGDEKAEKAGVDGVMIGRGIFSDLFCFSEEKDKWLATKPAEKISYYKKHLELHLQYWQGEKKSEPLKKFSKLYLTGFDGCHELRKQIYDAPSVEVMLKILNDFLDNISS